MNGPSLCRQRSYVCRRIGGLLEPKLVLEAHSVERFNADRDWNPDGARAQNWHAEQTSVEYLGVEKCTLDPPNLPSSERKRIGD